MCQTQLSRELALRIGLAAKALPDTRVNTLLHGLIEHCGLPLTEEKFKSLNYARYQRILQGCFTRHDIERSLSMLQASQAVGDPPANIKLYRPGDMPHSIRVAVASTDGAHIDAGFSDSQRYFVYQVSADEIRLIAIRSTQTDESLKSEQKQYYRAEILEDCQVFYAATLGSRAAAKLINKEVHPVCVAQKVPVKEILDQLQYVLSHSPPPWLARSMGFQPEPTKFSGEQAT